MRGAGSGLRGRGLDVRGRRPGGAGRLGGRRRPLAGGHGPGLPLRAAQRGLAQVQFIEGDIHDPWLGGPFDAIVERLALWQLPDPAEVLRRQATVLRPGGLVVASDTDITTSRSVPDTALWTQIKSWALEAFARAGLASDFGRRLWAIAEEAGLRPLGMIGIELYVWPGHEDGLVWMVESMRVRGRSSWAPEWPPPRRSV